ncbi:hypothetical protein PFISCL1PPCAC_21580, partial [Pristionchus fissidentatus]
DQVLIEEPETTTHHTEEEKGKKKEVEEVREGDKTVEKTGDLHVKTEKAEGEEKKEEVLETTSHVETTTVIEKKEEKTHAATTEFPVEAPEEEKEEEKSIKSNGEDTHQSVKKDLKAHVLSTGDESKNAEVTSARPPVPRKLSPAHEKFVLEHSATFAHEIRCIEVTSDDYFGKDLSPYSQHLKGLVFVGPILVVTAIYLVCTVLRTRLSHDTPTEFTDVLGTVFQTSMWLVAALSMFFIANHWALNWRNISNDTFRPEFPANWCCLILVSCLMMVVGTIEAVFHKRLYYDIVMKRSYRCYEMVESDVAAQHEDSFSSTNA